MVVSFVFFSVPSAVHASAHVMDCTDGACDVVESLSCVDHCAGRDSNRGDNDRQDALPGRFAETEISLPSSYFDVFSFFVRHRTVLDPDILARDIDVLIFSVQRE